jgi:hypothetical protein
MGRRKAYLLIASCLLFSAFFFFHCSSEKEETKIRLRWVKAYPAETRDNVQTGIYWSLSYLGATLDTIHKKEILQWDDSIHFTLDLEKAGFDPHALNAFSVIIDSLEHTEEFQKNNCIDLARFFVLTEHSSWHYYEITEASKTLEEFKKKHAALSPQEFHVFNSGVSKQHRNIRFAFGKMVSEMMWIAQEGNGSPDSGTFVQTSCEVFDVMKNGQLRFAVYDVNGNLIPGAESEHSHAGKPSKCMWCHEISVLPLFVQNPEPQRGISLAAFSQLVDSAQKQIDAYRNSLHSLVDFSQKQAHTQGELLYISFMEPSVLRLSNEWNVDTTAAKKRMGNLPLHVYPEFPFLGNAYFRYYADSATGYSIAKVPVSVRELYSGEPDYFKK